MGREIDNLNNVSEFFINKDDDIDTLVRIFNENGYQVLFDNDGFSSDRYWIKVAHIDLDEFSFMEVNDNEYIVNKDKDV